MRVTIDLANVRNECFVLMPFGPKFDPIYEEVLRPAIEEVDLVPTRADQIYGSKRIMRDVWDQIRGSRIVIAELTGRNANVLYELGLAHALGKPFVIITNSMDDVPFDLKDLRCIVYDKDHPKWGDSLARRVARTMKAVLEEAENYEPLFPAIETDMEYPSPGAADAQTSEDIKEAAEEVLDVAGQWRISEEWAEASDKTSTWTLQQDRHSITGFVISVPTRQPPAQPEWKVSQEVAGFIRGNRIELIATSYQILESANEDFGWHPDNWQGTLENGVSVRGEVIDARGHIGTFRGEKVTEEIVENEEP